MTHLTVIRFGFAGLTVEGRFEGPAAVDELRRPFVVSSPAQATVHVRRVDGVEEMEAGRALTVVGKGRGDWEIVQSSPERSGIVRRDGDGRPCVLVLFDRTGTEVEFLFSAARPPENVQVQDPAYPFRFPAMALLAKQGGLLLHACGVGQAGHGWLFLGHPGVGKTTIGQLWRQSGRGVVLNDEYSIVRSVDGQMAVCGTPWLGTGRMCAPGQARLERILFPEHGRRNVLSPLGPIEAFSRLLEQVYLPLWDEAGLAATIDTCVSLVQQVPCYRFGFVPRPEAIEFLMSNQP